MNAYFEALLETGVDEMAWDDVGDDSVSRVDPSRPESSQAEPSRAKPRRVESSREAACLACRLIPWGYFCLLNVPMFRVSKAFLCFPFSPSRVLVLPSGRVFCIFVQTRVRSTNLFISIHCRLFFSLLLGSRVDPVCYTLPMHNPPPLPPLFDIYQMEWPTVAEVHAYREEVYRLVTSVVQTAPDSAIASIDMSSPYWALPMSMEHERIHIETSSVLIRELPLECVARSPTWPAPHVSGLGFGDGSGGSSGSEGGVSSAPAATRSPVVNPLLAVEGGDVRLGKPRDFPRWGVVFRGGRRVSFFVVLLWEVEGVRRWLLSMRARC